MSVIILSRSEACLYLAASEAAAAVCLAQGLTFAAVLAATVGAVVGVAATSLLQGLGVAVELASAAAFTAAGVLSLLPQPLSARAEVATNRIDRFIFGFFPWLCALFHSDIRSALSTE
jgi:hypothetical protein